MYLKPSTGNFICILCKYPYPETPNWEFQLYIMGAQSTRRAGVRGFKGPTRTKMGLYSTCLVKLMGYPPILRMLNLFFALVCPGTPIVPRTWYLVPGTWYLVPGTNLVPGTW